MRKLILLLLLHASLLSYSQLSGSAARKYKKALKQAQSQKYDAAEKTLQPVLNENRQESEVWNLMVNIKQRQYYEAQKSDHIFDNIKVTVSKKSDSDTLANSLEKLFRELKPSNIKKKELINTCRGATAACADVEIAAIILRSMTLDVNPDTAVDEDAMPFYNKAEAAFQKGDMEKAIENYKEAVNLDSSYYHATMYLGDAYFNAKQYIAAIKYYKKAIALQPTMLEPRKYLVDVYLKMNDGHAASNAAIAALKVYPDVGVWLKLNQALVMEGKSFKRSFMSRRVCPVDSATNYAGEDIGYWANYLDALNEIKPYCNDSGIITKENTLTKLKYAEEYAWEKMLEKAPQTSFKKARIVKEEGYLDCYVLVTLFHQDNYKQFSHLAMSQPERVDAYINRYVITK